MGGLLACVLFVLLVAGRFQRPKTVEGTQFLLKDAAGNVVARLGQMNLGGTCLTLTSKGHAADAELCVHDDESSHLALLNHHGDSRVSLSPGFTSYEPMIRFPAGLYIGEELGKNFVNLSLGAETKLIIGHASHDSIVVSSSLEKPSINLFGRDGQTVWSTH